MIETLLDRYPQLCVCRQSLEGAVSALIRCYEQGGKLLLAGNGGSCADAEHIVGELMKGFLCRRPLPKEVRERMKAACPGLEDSVLEQLQGALPAVAVSSGLALITAFGNDVNPDLAFAQAVMGLGRPGDVFMGISTSGNAKNVWTAAEVARALGMTVIGLTGEEGGRLRRVADICICAPANAVYQVQELHLPIYHTLCAAVEDHFFGRV